MTRGPAARVAAVLGLLRPAIDEIVVALDDRAEPEVAASIAPVADRILAYEYAEPVDRPLPWLVRQCSGDWILIWDDDEIPSHAFLDALPGLAATGDVLGYWFPRRWLYPDADSYLAASPWQPDYQLRLVVNDLRLLRFPAEVHWQVASRGPTRYVEPPIYHADLVLGSLEARLRKAERYERLAPGKRVVGRPLNEAFYLPERAASAAQEPVPEEDRPAIASVLDVHEVTGGPPPQISAGAREDIDRHWEGRELSPGAYRARLELRDEPWPLVAGDVGSLDVLVENLGDAVWPWGSDSRPEIRLTYRWWRGDEVVAEGLRTPMPADLQPGATALVPLAVQAPLEPGRYRLAVDLVHEHVRWFECGFAVEIEVRRRRRLAVAGLVELDRLAELDPELEPLILAAEPERMRRRYSGAVAPGAETLLLPGLPDARLPAAAMLSARTARLVLAARRLRRGRLPGYGAEFLEALASAETVLIVDEGRRRRERWVARATGLAARVLGVRVR
jgi:hypothetical protein